MKDNFMTLEIKPNEGEDVVKYTYCKWEVKLNEYNKFLLEVDLKKDNEN